MLRTYGTTLALSLLLVVGGGLQSLLAGDDTPGSRDTKRPPDEEQTPAEPRNDAERDEERAMEPPLAKDRVAMLHDGVAAVSREFTYEIAFHTYGAEVYISDLQGEPVPAEGITGMIEMSYDEPGRIGDAADLVTIPSREGGDAIGLRADLDLDRVAQGEAVAILRLRGLPGDKETEAVVEAGFRLARIVQRICPQCYFAPRTGNACEGCKLPLVEQRSLFVCPVHAEVASDRPGSHCWRCATQALKLNAERAPVAKGIQ